MMSVLPLSQITLLVLLQTLEQLIKNIVLPASHKLQRNLFCLAQPNLNENQDCSSISQHGKARTFPKNG